LDEQSEVVAVEREQLVVQQILAFLVKAGKHKPAWLLQEQVQWISCVEQNQSFDYLHELLYKKVAFRNE
jgi:hypothetical protein